ncbi:transmembrane 18 [Brachionus plicatilis]|uniref:Transmembrane 18 n=1 Tax=Brachionus plicatilis TaxID=10195 RepID=A0A3M7PVV8_BRAPC|nr:transmembrane 18 [Brachionus plicatilis]
MQTIDLSKLRQSSSSFKFEATNIDGVLSFLRAIDWSQKWLCGLLLFHLATLLSIVFSRRCSNFQVFLFFALVTLCYGSERLNELGANHWHHFALEQYFDSGGFFISIVFSSPIIINCALLLILWLYESYLVMQRIVVHKKAALTNKNNNQTKDKKSL